MYRTHKPGPPKAPTSHARDTINDVVIEVQNGATSRIAFPCYYLYRKDGMPIDYRRVPPMVIDHFGWPAPDHRDDSWQPRIVRGLTVEPIHLKDEGYDQVDLYAYDPPSGFLNEVTIDDSVVRLVLNPRCDNAILEPIEVRFTIVATNSTESMSDIVANGIVRILPSLYTNVSPAQQEGSASEGLNS